MEISRHPIATEHLPAFITAPGDTDVMMVVMVAVLALSVVAFGVLFFRLHSLPEQIAHKSQKLQAELVAVLCLISLFTHMHIFWVAGLVLALLELPDFGTPLSRIAASAEKLAGLELRAAVVDAAPKAPGHARDTDAAEAPPPRTAVVLPAVRPELAEPKLRERIHV